MNKTKHIAVLLFFAMGISLFFACKKTPDMPPVTPFNIGNTVTISQLRAIFSGNNCSNYKFTKDVSLYATVTMDASSGNIYKQVYLRDQTGTISMKQLNAGGLFQGDSLRINLNGAVLDKASSGSYLQIDSMDVSNSSTNKVIKLAVGKNPVPLPVTILQLNNSISYSGCIPQSVYDGQLVQLNDVQFSVADTGLYFIPHNTSGPVSTNYYLTDCGALNNIQVYTSSFAYQTFTGKVPGKSGSLVAIASIYTSGSGVASMQLTLRSNNEVKLTQPLCGVDTLTQNFNTCSPSVSNVASVLPGWYNINQLGYAVWSGTQANNSLNFPSATSHNSGNPRNIIWLVTPPIQASATKNISFKWAAQYWSANQLSVKISTDFNGTNLGSPYAPVASPAHWTDITTYFPTIATTPVAYSSTFTSFIGASATPVQLSQFLPANYTGTFYIGFCYTGNQTDSTSAYAIDNVVIKD